MIVKIDLAKKTDQITQIADQLHVSIKNNKLSFLNNFGAISLSYYNFNSIELYFYNFKIQTPSVFVSENNKEKGKYICSFNLSETSLNKSVSDNDKTDFQIKGNDLLFYSPEFSTSFKIEPEIKYMTVVIAFDYKSIEPFIIDKKDDFLRQGFFIYRPIEPSLSLRLKQFFSIEKETITDMLKLNSFLLELLVICFEYLFSEKNQTNHNLDNKDIESAFNVKNILESSIMTSCPKISELAMKANMSQTKLKTIFKQIFGESIHQYYIKYKMYKARELLLKEQYSVSEIGYKLGYNSTSHFISLFKKHFSETPKDYLLKNI